MQSIASAYFEAQKIPQDLVTGIVVTLIGLIVLFSVKPKLSIDNNVILPSVSDKASHGFSVTNRGLLSVIEVKAKLFTVDTSKEPRTRTYIELEFDELFQLAGRLAERRHRSDDLKRDNKFRFRVKVGDVQVGAVKVGDVQVGAVKVGDVQVGDVQVGAVKIGDVKIGDVKEGETIDLSGNKYLVFQVSARHGFTNFTSLAIQRWTFKNNQFIPWDGKQNPFT